MQAQILLIIIPAMTLLFAAVFTGLWWQDRSKRYILAYAGWFLAVAVGIALQAWIIKDFGPLEVVIFHLVSSSGLILMLWGVAARDGRRAPLAVFISMTLATGVVLWFARSLEVQPVVLMAQNFNAGVLFAMGAYGKWLASTRHSADRILVFALTVLAAYSIFRPSITVVLQSQMTMAEYQTSVVLTVNMAITALLCLMLSFALVATIVADRMDKQRDEAAFDPLSGVRMRGAFETEAKALLNAARSDGVAACLIVADIDHFKAVNDAFGHVAGDRVIAGFGAMLGQTTRGRDITGRVGGEEFCILVWKCNLAQATKMSERIRKTFSASSHREGTQDLRCTASFGVAEMHGDEAYTALFERADAALYRAKRAGRDRVVADGAVDTDTSETVVDFAPRASSAQRG